MSARFFLILAAAVISNAVYAQSTEITAPTGNEELLVYQGGSDPAHLRSGLVPSNTANGLKSATTTVTVNGSAAPSAGQVLTAVSPTAANWQAGSSGALTLISTQTASNSAVQWTGLSSSYNNYELICFGIQPTSPGNRVGVQFGTGAGPTWVTSGYNWAGSLQPYGANAINGAHANAANIIDLTVGNSLGSGASLALSGAYLLTAMNTQGSFQTVLISLNSVVTAGGTANTAVLTGYDSIDTTQKTAIRLYDISGGSTTLLAGVCSLYGLSN